MQPPNFSQLKSLPQTRENSSSIVPFLLAIGGATATGKSSLALALAQRLLAQNQGGVILSADSRQVYREFDIGTAKPSARDRQQVPHYLIDICAPTETLTLAQYQHQAQGLIQQFHQVGTSPLLVGGTGLYIEAVVKGLRIPPVAPQPELRRQLEALGQPYCYGLLKGLDAIAAQRIHANDLVRTVRALEVFYVTGQPMSALQGEVPPAYPVFYLALDSDTAALERRIVQRTQAMVAAGLVEEVTALAQKYGSDLPLLQTLGYAEILQYLQGDCSLPAAVDNIVLHTCQFAKRQRTWFRNRAAVQWFDADAGDLVDRVWQQINNWSQVNLK
ncbi:tRNA (adenosine(37)-N6)-dimethylallyltransferase MiaA [filamentous cyanobacterium CCT1]|nr:tRNA (adenosine(37)-N6)-dimethylallyltransferase MiaA [filamentous cyanobacterium CCT1]PSN80045.1 tRNA (adenosine(37)-N6)-dimethylallyltransferase MiaA [filamentous cyanobacterium CCP4]